MSETTRACVRGCAILRRHLTDCDGTDPAGRECRGCLPRRADHGLLCWPCHRRFELMLTDAPTVYRWLSGNLTAGQSAARAKDDFERGGKGAKLPDPPAPLKVDTLDVRDLLADRLHLWVEHFIEGTDLAPPKPLGEHAPLAAVIEADAAFLLRWLPSVERCDWIGDWWEELAECFRDAHAIAPWRPAMRRVPRVVCPRCGETNLVIFGGESDISCLSCRSLMTSAQFELWGRVLRMEATG